MHCATKVVFDNKNYEKGKNVLKSTSSKQTMSLEMSTGGWMTEGERWMVR